MRRLTQLVPQRGIPLLTPAESHGPDLERFRDPSQALQSWTDKQLQLWRFTGQLSVAGGRSIGFQLAFYQRRTQRDFLAFIPTRWILPKAHPSAFAARFSLTDPTNADSAKTYRGWHRGTLLIPSTGFLPWRGFAAEERFHVECGGWYARLREENGTIQLYASAGGTSLHLELKPASPPLYHGQSGYLQRADRPEQSSFSCSVANLVAAGQIVLDGRLHSVTGAASLDHEKSGADSAAEGHRDWVSARFDSGEELFLMLGWEPDDGLSRFSAGTWVDAEGRAKHLVSSEIQVENVEFWTSPDTKCRYPVKRRVRIEPLNLIIEFRPLVPHQEVESSLASPPPFWAGVMNVRAANRMGWGFMELQGYGARPLQRAIRFLTAP